MKVVLSIAILVLSIISTYSQSLPAEKIKQIEQMISAQMSKDRVPGLSIAIVVDGKLNWSHGYGIADLENFVPAKATTAYRSASIGKPITATAIMQLVEAGKLDLDAPIQKYCRAFPQKQRTKLHDIYYLIWVVSGIMADQMMSRKISALFITKPLRSH